MRIKSLIKVGVSLSGLALISACSWVAPIEGSDQVALVKPMNVAGCQKLGHTVSFVQDKIVGLTRNQETVIEELITLGKNQAVDMGGDTIVQTDTLKEGKIGFDIYKCKS